MNTFRDVCLAIQSEVQTPQWWIRLGLMVVLLVVFIVLGLPRLYAAVAVTVLMVVLSQVGPLKSPKRNNRS